MNNSAPSAAGMALPRYEAAGWPLAPPRYYQQPQPGPGPARRQKETPMTPYRPAARLGS